VVKLHLEVFAQMEVLPRERGVIPGSLPQDMAVLLAILPVNRVDAMWGIVHHNLHLFLQLS
jgi:hypothetical protein